MRVSAHYKALTMLLLASLLAAQNLPADACKTAPFGWTCQAIWVAGLSAREQRAALFVFAGALNEDSEKKLAPNIKSKADFCWVTAVNGFGYSMLSMATTKNPDLKTYFDYSSGIYARMERGVLTGAEAHTLLETHKPSSVGREFIDKDAAELKKSYGLNMHRAESALIADAKIAAAEYAACKT